MGRWRIVYAYATGLIPFSDEMLLEDFHDAIQMREFAEFQYEGGIHRGIPAAEWVEELMEARRQADLEGVLNQPLT